MNIELFLPVIFLLVIAIFITFFLLTKMNDKAKKRIFIFIPIVLLLAFAMTYIPHSVVSMEPNKVSKITIFDGNTGYDIEITDEDQIDHIITNLNAVTFQKGKSSFGYMGYSFRTTIYNQKRKRLKDFIINSNDTIRYKGFFYTDKAQSIDYDYIKDLISEKIKSETN
ncbi:hypothetical protein QA612_17515 [Evansella sp. AB-P1]|uniref:hypothetical protein n=1 Tax=Evansella sp. AB-P1 TaxID=3037653 RepID=UPI00241CAAE2|nr:hypothetical protein [Evansella sp. AB-P1]MDG5789261.1 hypothetical protein [Evansella sp. AB-P1]